MVLLIGYIVLIGLNLTFKRNKFLYVIDFLYMWILIGWSSDNADYAIYVSRYNYPDVYRTLEPLYVFLEKLSSAHGFDYSQFLVIMSGVCLFMRFILIYKMTSKHNQVIGYYLIYPFIMDIVQVRMFYAMTIMMWAIYLLYKVNRRYQYFIFIALTMCAVFIHNSCVIFLLLIIAKIMKKENVKKYSKRMIIGVAFATLLLAVGALNKIGYYVANIIGFGRKFTETIAAAGMAYKFTHRLVYMAEIIIFFVAVYLICNQVRKNVNKYESVIQNKEWIEEVDFIEKCNYLLFFILPLAWLSGDIYRVQHGFAMMVYILIANIVPYKESKKKGVISLSRVKTEGYTFALAFGFLLLFALLLPDLRERVFLPAFFNNRLFG